MNDPLSVAGYTFHQNGYGPAPALVVRDDAGRPLWDGTVPMTDSVDGLPYGVLGVPGRDIGLEMQLRKLTDGTTVLLMLPYRVTGTNPDGSPIREDFRPIAPAVGETAVAPDVGLSIEFQKVGAFTLLIAKKDPGPGTRVDRVRVADRRHHDQLLQTAPSRLDASRDRWAARDRVALGPVRGRRARVRAAARPARRGAPPGLTPG